MDQNYHSDRRAFLKKASLGSVLALSIPEIVSAAFPVENPPKGPADGAVILFQGDSITDAGRNKEEGSANNSGALGKGYAFLAACELLYQYPGKNLSVYNKGISGNKVHQLADRWEEDCLSLKPDILSILIGVNDYWHKRNGDYDGTVEVYHTDYKALLDRTKQQLPDVQLVIGEPFAVKGGKAVDDSWY
ncbi:MAG TPA: GDSL-type esterase/lipase family protein, partial [Anseongella sp.]|nr:GDSL-type esterase/lipase family protein [Anseongella sp.]